MSVSHGGAMLAPLARDAAVESGSVVFESRGAVLVIGDDAGIAPAVEQVARFHRTTAFAPGIDEHRFASGVTTVGTRVAALQGRMGAFRAQVRGPGGMKDIGAASAHRDGFFDLVLDLGEKPLISLEVPPLGYFAPGPDAVSRAGAIAAMRSLVGSFTKPRFFEYRPELCAHSASGVVGCTRCLEVCATAAITSAAGRIHVDPYLCQGCATCTLACPTGALTFNAPDRDRLRRRLVDLLKTSGPNRAIVVVCASVHAAAVRRAVPAGSIVVMDIDALPAFGEELWFEAFALGAAAVALIDAGLTRSARELVRARVSQARLALQALGVDAGRLAFLSCDRLSGWFVSQRPGAAAMSGAAAMANEDGTVPTTGRASGKRTAILGAVERLAAPHTARKAIELPAAACFGEVVVDTARCSLCLSCANLCPTGALAAGRGDPLQLRFVEDDCVQCRLCERACPERAISLHPRFVPAAGARGASRLLIEQDDRLRCTACGDPFINRRLLASSLERIGSHPVLAEGGRDRLLTCPACRRKALLQT